MPLAVMSAGKSWLARCSRSLRQMAVFALGINQPMRDVVLIQEVIKLTAFARIARRHDAEPGKLAIALQPLPAHDERAHDRFAHPGQFGQRLPEPLRRHLQNLTLVRPASNGHQRRRAHQHRYVADKIPRTTGRENLLLAVTRLEGLECAAQDHRQRHIALAGCEYQLAPPHNAPRSQRLEQG